MNSKVINYYLQEIMSGGFEVTIQVDTDKEKIINIFNTLNEKNHNSNFKIIKEEVVCEVIAQSEDCRQTVFDFC